MRGPENKPNEYHPQKPITLGIFDLTSARADAIIRLAHMRLTHNPRGMIAKKLIAEDDNHHLLKDNLVEILLKRMGISTLYAELPVKGGKLQRVGRIELLHGKDSVMAFEFRQEG